MKYQVNFKDKKYKVEAKDANEAAKKIYAKFKDGTLEEDANGDIAYRITKIADDIKTYCGELIKSKGSTQVAAKNGRLIESAASLIKQYCNGLNK